MNLPHMDRQIGTGAEEARTPDTRLHDRWLVIARLLWFAVVELVVGIVISSIPTHFASLHILRANADPHSQQLTQDGVHALYALGLSIDSYTIYAIILNALFVLGFLLVGVGIDSNNSI